MKEISNKRLGTKFTAYEFEYLCKQVQKTFIKSKEFLSLIKRKKEALMKADWEGFITQIYNSQEDGIDERPAQQFVKSIINVLNKETEGIDDIGTITFADIIEEYVEETKEIVTSEKAKTIISSKLAKYLRNRRKQDYVQARDNNKLIPFGRGKKKEDKYTGIIFLRYIGYTSFDDLKEKAALIKGEIDKITNTGIEVNESSGDTENSQTETDLRFFRKFYLIGLRISQRRAVKHQILIDFENGVSKMISENNRVYDKGTFEYHNGYIRLSVDRYNQVKTTWLPFTCFFQWNKPFKELKGAVGTYSGVGYEKERAIAGHIVLVRQEDYNEDKSKLPLEIERYLFLEHHGTSAISDVDFREALKPTKIDTTPLEALIGDHELHNIGRQKSESYYSYVFKVAPNFCSIIDSPSEEYEYIVRPRIEGGILLLHISANQRDNLRNILFTNCIAIDLNRPLYDNGHHLIYGGFCTGISRSSNHESFPIVLVMNPLNPTKKRYALHELRKEFLDDKSRSTLNQNILKQLLRLEDRRAKETHSITNEIHEWIKNKEEI